MYKKIQDSITGLKERFSLAEVELVQVREQVSSLTASSKTAEQTTDMAAQERDKREKLLQYKVN